MTGEKGSNNNSNNDNININNNSNPIYKMMHNTIAHDLLTNAQPVPKHHPKATFPPALYSEGDVIWRGI